MLLDKVSTDAVNQDRLLKQNISNVKYEKALFSPALFPVQSVFFTPYCEYLRAQLNNLTSLIQLSNSALTSNAIERFEEQITALINALNAASIMAKERQFQRQRAKRNTRKVVEKITQSSRELYAKLNETKDFERRLEDMLTQAQQALNAAQVSEKEIAQSKVLAIHQRLGRCRKAISQVEYEIERAEKLNR